MQPTKLRLRWVVTRWNPTTIWWILDPELPQTQDPGVLNDPSVINAVTPSSSLTSKILWRSRRAFFCISEPIMVVPFFFTLDASDSCEFQWWTDQNSWMDQISPSFAASAVNRWEIWWCHCGQLYLTRWEGLVTDCAGLAHRFLRVKRQCAPSLMICEHIATEDLSPIHHLHSI